MNKKHLIELFDIIQKNISGNIKFNYWLAKIRNRLKQEIETIKDVIKYDDDFIEFQSKRIELCKQYAKKDKEGNPIVKNNNFVIDNEKEFNIAYEKLKSEYETTIKKAEEKNKEIEQFLETPVEIQLPQININDIPDNTFSPDELELLMSFNIINEQE